MSPKHAVPPPSDEEFSVPAEWDRPNSADILPFRQKPRSHVLVKKRDASGRLVIDDVDVPEIDFYTAR